MIVLKLTPQQADQVKGLYGYNELRPIARDDFFILPLAVLDEPDFAAHHEMLNGLPRVEVADGDEG